jgi:hypothetical protein
VFDLLSLLLSPGPSSTNITVYNYLAISGVFDLLSLLLSPGPSSSVPLLRSELSARNSRSSSYNKIKNYLSKSPKTTRYF